MTTPNNTISIDDVVSEFHPITNNSSSSARDSNNTATPFTDLRGEGTLVKDYGTGYNSGVPTSGAISLNDLKGKVGTRTVAVAGSNNSYDVTSAFNQSDRDNHIHRTVVNATMNAGVTQSGTANKIAVFDTNATINGAPQTGSGNAGQAGAAGNPGATFNNPTLLRASDINAGRFVGGGGQGGGGGTGTPGQPGNAGQSTSGQHANGGSGGHWNFGQHSHLGGAPPYFQGGSTGSGNHAGGNPGQPGNSGTAGNPGANGNPGNPGQAGNAGAAGNPGTGGNGGSGGHTGATTGASGNAAHSNSAQLSGWNGHYSGFMFGNNAHQRVNFGDRNNRLRMINGTHALIMTNGTHSTYPYSNNGNQYCLRRMSTYAVQGVPQGNISSSGPNGNIDKVGPGGGQHRGAFNGNSGNTGSSNPGNSGANGGAAGPNYSGNNITVNNNR